MKQRRSGKGLIAPIILIALGAVFLAQNGGLLPTSLVRDGWPVLLIALGAIVLVRRLAWSRVNQRGPKP
ncbi:hypothetical protein OR16_30924 [Cupriavidus basilensis OR16]|uniref:LiaI-LiaF-like transmembrane region domain-containing protein n=1 Tax=Cupriavidus basilensis OR16 TaxID=1127483 RepID=H1SD61_9BURK|nr:DUF5668 domain-containing protein [Cupriavidus basilensis]EHP39509.1 hypothetical protein OR16_30924 [Cupriavidus basilensis OR16]